MVMVEEISSRRLAGLEAEWTDLLATVDQPSPYMGWDWIRTWVDIWGDRFDVVILTIRDSCGELIGVAPLSVHPSKEFPRLRHLMVVGQKLTWSEYLDVLARPGEEAKVAAAAVGHLLGPAKRRWDLLWIEKMLQSSPMIPQLEHAFADRGCGFRTVPTAPSPYLPLPDSTDKILANTSRNFRGQVKQARNRVAKQNDSALLIAGVDIGFEEAYDELVRLHHLRWPHGGAFLDEPRRQFFRQWGARALERGELFLALLSVGGTAIAGRFDFVFDGKMWCHQGGWDDDYSSLRPGMALTLATMEWGIENGLSEYDFLAGEHDYKLRWCQDQRELRSFQAANKWSPRGRLYAAMRLNR